MLNGSSLLRALQQCPSPKLLAGLLLEEDKCRCQDGIIVPHCFSTCASAASVCGNQKVISIPRYISTAVDNAVWPCSRWPVVAYSVPSPRWQWATSGCIPSS